MTSNLRLANYGLARQERDAGLHRRSIQPLHQPLEFYFGERAFGKPSSTPPTLLPLSSKAADRRGRLEYPRVRIPRAAFDGPHQLTVSNCHSLRYSTISVSTLPESLSCVELASGRAGHSDVSGRVSNPENSAVSALNPSRTAALAIHFLVAQKWASGTTASAVPPHDAPPALEPQALAAMDTAPLPRAPSHAPAS